MSRFDDDEYRGPRKRDRRRLSKSTTKNYISELMFDSLPPTHMEVFWDRNPPKPNKAKIERKEKEIEEYKKWLMSDDE